MQVVLVSSCEHKAWKRTRAVLDRYALRIGERTWQTPITSEGLETLRSVLKRQASKNTAIACWRSEGYRGMHLLWTVGRKHAFGTDGQIAVGTRKRRVVSFAPLPAWVAEVAFFSAVSGLSHDVGKLGRFFQWKLRLDRPVADPVRHEWLSYLLVHRLLTLPEDQFNTVTWDDLWQSLQKEHERLSVPFRNGFGGAGETLLYLVLTHHRLPSEVGSRQAAANELDWHNHVRTAARPALVGEPSTADIFQPQGAVSDETWQRLKRVFRRMRELDRTGDTRDVESWHRWRATALLARVALILADHRVSSEERFDKQCQIYANTAVDHSGVRRLNQDINWHLKHVSKVAGINVTRIAQLPEQLRGVSTDSAQSIDRFASGRFEWQQIAAEAVAQARAAQPEQPMLLFLMAGTGTGKTIACARLALRASRNQERVRFTTAMNLRTLALQTGCDYANKLGIDVSDVATVIGDRNARLAFESTMTPHADDDELSRDELLDYLPPDATGEPDELPPWLEHFLADSPQMRAIMSVPVAVCTIDYIVHAGEPQRQHKHAVALMRIATSDLVLDEIDSYDPPALAAVLRLVQLCAFFGRNVIAASATLAAPVASAVWQAFSSGVQMRQALERRPVQGGPGFLTGFLDDCALPQLHQVGSEDELLVVHRARTTAIGEVLATRPQTRRAALISVDRTAGVTGWLDAIAGACRRFHSSHRWQDPATGKTVSFGVVRVANIGPAIHVARTLSRMLGNHARVACYHAQLPRVQRYRLEHALDAMLSRSRDAEMPVSHPSVREVLDNPASSDDIMFIVVATPVEEIGRDHDFDWAVVEPSSSYSLVQLPGRVRRHRFDPVDMPNVGILQFNLRAVRGEPLVFHWPGLESIADSGTSHPYHDMAEAIAWDVCGDRVDARWRFDSRHPFAQADDTAVKGALRAPLQRITGKDAASMLWISELTYRAWSLRDTARGESIRLDPQEQGTKVLEVVPTNDGPYGGHSRMRPRFVDRSNLSVWIERAQNDWLVERPESLVAWAESIGLDSAGAFDIEVRLSEEDLKGEGSLLVDRSFGCVRAKSADIAYAAKDC
jgi:CRISPR-associated endonuclease/helicase Cas3